MANSLYVTFFIGVLFLSITMYLYCWAESGTQMEFNGRIEESLRILRRNRWTKEIKTGLCGHNFVGCLSVAGSSTVESKKKEEGLRITCSAQPFASKLLLRK
ncbi:unnamed protein product [Lepeophtheirus salmonis]|uniref:(salmon louse) hypothetical protein n=1 Tax=Lepeophtheirus salmonis TaxID=72036 RepID=A0A7R8CLW9_LEPSM|nr:unnamed protein product [Lepeophtheirus salmonis]CAF2858158.1 unnamed protein product [Lepeophtheirus salmonis]